MSNYDDLVAKAKRDGRIEHQFDSPFSVPVMDVGFRFMEVVISETRKFIESGLGVLETLSNIAIVTTHYVKLDRCIERSKSVSVSRLYLIRGKDSKLSAVLYMGCTVEEQP